MKREQAEQGEIIEQSAPPAPKIETRGRKKKIQIVRREEYDEPINEQVIDTTAKVIPEENDLDPNDPLSIIENLLDSVDEGDAARWKIKVYRLPDYRKTGIWQKGANASFCGPIPPSIDYLEVTQQLFGAGDYRFELIQPDGKFARRWTESIEAPVNIPMSAPGAPASGNGRVSNYFLSGANQAQPQSLTDQLKSVAELFAQVKSIRDSIGLDQPTVIQATQPAAPEPPSIQDRIKEKVLEAALDKIVGSGDPERTERVLAMALGHETGSSWADLLKEAIVSLAPIATQVVGMMIRNAASGQSVTSGGMPQHNGVSEQSSSVAPALTAGPLTSWSRLCRAIITGYANSFPVDSIALLIDSHGNQFAEDRDRITQLIEAEPAQAISGVLLAAGIPVEFLESNPQFGNYIAELQASYQDETQDSANEKTVTTVSD